MRAYFTGHDHFYDDARIDDADGNPDNDLRQFIVGSGGAPFYSSYSYDGNNSPYAPVNAFHEMNYGYVLADVSDNTVTLTWKHRLSPGVYAPGGDSFSYTVPEPLATAALLVAVPMLLGRRSRQACS